MPSTLSLHACTTSLGLIAVTESKSRRATSFELIGRFLTHIDILESAGGACCRREICTPDSNQTGGRVCGEQHAATHRSGSSS